MNSDYVRKLKQELLDETLLVCPSSPCVGCLNSACCQSFLNFRKENPGYDVKYASYVTAHKSLLREVEQRVKQRSLCTVEECERVPQQGRRLIEDKSIFYKENVMKLDFSEVKTLENIQAPEGVGTYCILKATEKVSLNGTHMLVIDAKEVETEGFVRDNVCLEGPGAFRAKQFFASLGLLEEEASQIEAPELVGMNFEAEIEIVEYEGKNYSKVKKYLV